ncbi:MFS transporter [Streptacidiphilus fuscans]|uniref:MFS transporter n=1 Tax=Streptacidiphilus fuscans TaxID=2789292 RepID=A0A931B9Z3_9ACTN|nr:MFS transporter [Streptacidiphilus fuscans]MBF9069600.1 MFS transporter [Streptacidiphilus fuscans]
MTSGAESGVGRLARTARGRIVADRSGGVLAAVLLATALGIYWARDLSGVAGDLSAQYAWADFAAHHPGSADDLAWYGGISPGSYSLLAPYLMAAVGVVGTGLLALLSSAALLGVLLRRAGGRFTVLTSLWGAFALWCNVAAGRIPYALGLAFGLGAVVLATGGEEPHRPGPGRIAGCAALSLLATAASPLAGLFLEVVAAALILTRRQRTGWALAIPPAVLVAGAAWLFPTNGVDPITLSTVVWSTAFALAAALLCPRGWRTVRIASLVYAVGVLLTWAVPSPIGGNVGRLAMVLVSVVFLAMLTAEPRPSVARPSGPRLAGLLVAFGLSAYWLVAADLVGLPAPTPTAEAAPLVAELHRLHADQARLEAVPMLNHWESWGLVNSADLARGWNRQLDVTRNPLFYGTSGATLTPDSYHAWLQQWAVAYVAMEAGPKDVAARGEAAIVASHPAWLRPVWHDAHWQLFRVTDAEPLVAAPARVLSTDPADVVLSVPRAGTVPLRLPWSPWLAASGPAGTSACLVHDGAWTDLRTDSPGVYRISAPYAWTRGTPCP